MGSFSCQPDNLAFYMGFTHGTVSRATCFLKPIFGGIGVCNLFLTADALMLASLVMIIDSDEDSSFFLFKYLLGVPMCVLD